MAHAFVDSWHRQPGPSRWIVALAAIVVGVMLLNFTWAKITRYIATLAHESGHALTGVLIHRKLRSIRLRRDTSGLTTTYGSPGRISNMIVTAAGYPAPALFAVALAYAYSVHRPGAAEWVVTILLLLAVPFLRGLFSLLVVLVSFIFMIATVMIAPESVQYGVVSVLVIFLPLAGVRTIVEQLHDLANPALAQEHSDSASLAHLSKIPARLWDFWFITISVVSMGAAGWLLLR